VAAVHAVIVPAVWAVLSTVAERIEEPYRFVYIPVNNNLAAWSVFRKSNAPVALDWLRGATGSIRLLRP
jgi:hypothetical protein